MNGRAIYVTVTNFIEVCDEPFFGFGQIELYRSLDNGRNWSRRIIQRDETFITDPGSPVCGADGVINQGSAPAAGPGDDLYVTWEGGWFAPLTGGPALPRATIAFRRSPDGGATWDRRVTIASICSQALDAPAGYNRTSSNDFPRLAVARQGERSGRIYVTFQDCSAASGPAAPLGPDVDVYVTFSDDKGMTWSTPVAVHPVADGRAQFWPVVMVDGKGHASVSYYEMQDVNVTPDSNDDECSVRIGGPLDAPILKKSKVSTLSNVYLARSVDGGLTFLPPERVTTQTTNWCEATPIDSIIPNFGDYNDARRLGARTHIVWADGRNRGRRDHIPTTFYATGR